MRTLLGELLMKLRQERQITRRRFALDLGFDPSYYARIERGEAAPPNDEVLARIAERLGIAVGTSDEWMDLLYRADVARGRIPAEILKEQHIAEMLPALFAKLRTQTVTSAEELYDVARKIASSRVVAHAPSPKTAFE